MKKNRHLLLRESRHQFGDTFRTTVVERGKRSIPFMPGLFFIVLGALVLFVPKLLIAAFAGLFLFLGALLCYGGWKFMQFRHQLSNVAKQLEGKIQIQTFQVRMPEDGSGESDQKKIVYH